MATEQGEAGAPAVPSSVGPEEGKKKKGKPKDLVIPPKKPKLSKAERRALQEAQRKAKAEQRGGGGGKSTQGKKPHQQQQQQQQHKSPIRKSGSEIKEPSKASESETPNEKEDDKTVSLFSHLPPYYGLERFPSRGVTLGVDTSSSNSHKALHPAVLQVGLLYAKGTIRGGNARCRAMLYAFEAVLQDYEPPEDCKDVRQDVDSTVLKPSFNFWAQHCRPHSVSMGNAFTLLKSAVASLDRTVSKEDVVHVLVETIRAYERERIDFADRAIAEHASSKIVNGDVILIYGCSQVISILLTEASETTDFSVVVVDSRPLLEGKMMLQELRQAGIECTYILLNSLSYVLKEVTKVFLGASALMSDGSVLSRVGTACVALMATQADKPVLVCCETYKMSNRVQLESITGNELGNPECVSGPEIDKIWKETPNLKLLNLMYDLTPADFVSGIVTEMGILPPTSVAVLLREMNPQGGAS